MSDTMLLDEERRNRLIRRADWRFLLPNPEPGTSICFSGGSLAAATAHISTRLIDPARASAGECDLAVALNPDASTLRKAWGALRSGGACYTEWYTPLVGGTAGVRHRLGAAGFTGVRCHWTWPWPILAAPGFWLPLDEPGALGHFLTHRAAAPGAVGRLLHAVHRRSWLYGLLAGLALPICAVAVRPPSELPEPAMGSALLATIRAGWSGWGCGSADDRLSAFVLTAGKRSVNKIVALYFAEPDPRPRLVVKLPRVRESVQGLRREAAALRAVHLARPAGVTGVPRVLFCDEHDGVLALGQTPVSGLPLATQLTEDNYRLLALAATEWLSNLAGTPRPVPREAWWDRLVASVLDRFGADFAPVLAPGALDAARARLAGLDALPLVWEHRDFGPWNVLIGPGGTIGALDWESAEMEGLPALDLLYFLAYLAFFRDRAVHTGRYRESYRATLDPATATGAVRADCLKRYAAPLGLAPATLATLGLLVWPLHAWSEYQRLAADVGGTPAPAALRNSLFFGLWIEELRALHGIDYAPR